MGQMGGEPGGEIWEGGGKPHPYYIRDTDTGKVHMRLEDTLSETWHELLGSDFAERLLKGEKGDELMASVELRDASMLATDPWSELLGNQGVKMVDLSGLAPTHVSLSEVEVEQALQIMWERIVEESGQG
jgi:hypothetical protein